MSQNSRQADNHKMEDLIPVNQWGSDVSVSADTIRQNLLEIKNEIAHYNSKIIAVTKYYGLNSIIEGYNAGIRDFGESRAKDAIEKIQMLPEDIRKNSTFHFIGHLQTNKVDKVVKHFDYIHSVDSLKLATAISTEACQLNKRENILLQVNIANEPQKYGYSKTQLREELSRLLQLNGVNIVGLMNIAPLNASEKELQAMFAELRYLRNELEIEFQTSLPELSMGMSNDYKIAIKEGATYIRIGRKLFN